MTDREARTLARMNLIRSCLIKQVHEEEWEISLYGADGLYPDDCIVHQFGHFLMTDDLSDTQWFMSVEDAIEHLVKLGIEPQIELQPLWPAELARLQGVGLHAQAVHVVEVAAGIYVL